MYSLHKTTGCLLLWFSFHTVLSLLNFALTIPYYYYHTKIKINTTQCPCPHARSPRRTQFHIRSEWNECEIACNWAYIVSHANYTAFFSWKGSVIEWNDRVVCVEVRLIRLLASYVLFLYTRNEILEHDYRLLRCYITVRCGTRIQFNSWFLHSKPNRISSA